MRVHGDVEPDPLEMVPYDEWPDDSKFSDPKMMQKVIDTVIEHLVGRSVIPLSLRDEVHRIAKTIGT